MPSFSAGFRVFWKIIEGGKRSQDFFVKIWWGNPYRRGVYIRGGVSSASHWYCVDFIAIIVFTQQVLHLQCLFFFLTLYNIWGCYYFESKLMLVMLMKMLLIKKICNVVLYSSEHEEITFLYVYFCVYLVIHWDDIVQTMLSNVVKEMGGGGGGGGWVAI